MIQPAVSTENFTPADEKSTERPIASLANRELDLVDVGDGFDQTRIALFVLVREPE